MSTGETRAAVRLIEVDEDGAGQRLDNFLLRTLKGVPKSYIYRIVRKGEVRINKSRARPDYRLQAGDVVRVPPVRTATRTGTPPNPTLATALKGRILYEDDDLLVVDKPSGMAVHGGSGIVLGVIEALRALRPEARFLELVHRLDRDTSGCLIVAKKRSVLRTLHALLRTPGAGIEKHYLALLKGPWRGGARKVNAPLQKHVLRSGERMVEVTETGKPSVSVFTPKAMYAGAVLVDIRLVTGRTHQARVHAASLGTPIAGDEKYGDREFNRSLRKLGLKRLFLHAASVSFPHPRDGRKLTVEAPLPPELVELSEHLQQVDKHEDREKI